MQSEEPRLVIVSVEVVLASVLLLTGSALFYAALYGYLFPSGTTQLIPVIMFWGVVLLVLGMLAAWDAGKRLRGRRLVIIAVADLFGAFAFVLLVLSPPANLVLGWLTIAGLNNMLLDIALVAGHIKEQPAKKGFEANASSHHF